eukprot:TRINITY_DN3676_c0_g1_i1.p1 TRINITY_DN3676_c0_g1~~TRINITY_DN3676_c0_g1_i1.p1  ORF type:complete len:445 (+),score=125.44 TRINITY_DN3676_c0_g1_i1:92-1426(+)
MDDLQILILTLILGSTLALILYISRLFQAREASEVSQSAEKETEEHSDDETKPSSQQGKKKAKAPKKIEKGPSFSHPWLLTNLKGHSGRVLDLSISANGKYIASSSEDRSVLIWFFKDLEGKDHKTWRGNVEFDHGLKVSWSPDSKAYVVHRATNNAIQVYKILKKESGGTPCIAAAPIEFGALKFDVMAMEFASNGRFIMTCTDKSTLIIWSLKGEVLAEIETYHMNINYCAKISPCGRFVGTSGFTPDVEIYEVKFHNKTGEFIKIERAFSLTGHNSGVYAFDFNSDSSRMVTASKDGQIRLFDTKIEYSKGQDPSLLASGPLGFESNSSGLLLSLSPDSRSIALASGKDLRFFSGSDLKPLGVIQEVHSADFTCITFDAESKYLITSGDKHLHVFHNVPGLRETIRDLEGKLGEANTTTKKEFLLSQITEAKKSLKKIVSE